MANNSYINKVEFDGRTLIDLTNDTVTPATLISGITAHDKSGVTIIGTYESGQSIQPITITTNGVYIAQNGVDGYSPVTVNVSRDDPFALTDYIESSGTQMIETDYVSNSNTRFEMICNFQNKNSYPVIFGGGSSYVNVGWNGVSGHVQFATSNYASINFSNYYSKKCVVELQSNRFKVEAENGNITGIASIYTLGNNTRNTGIFQNVGGAASNFTSMKLYRFRIYESNVLVREFVPWTDANDVVCVKETVSGNLLYNAGTGVFTRGSDA